MNEPNNQAVAVRESFSIMQGAGRVEELVGQIQLIQQVMRQTMKDGEHYGTIPGCGDKKVLKKPGAEKLTFIFRIAPSFALTVSNLDGGHREISVLCTLNQIGTGVFLGQGVGSCSTMEDKYRFRKGPKTFTGRPAPKGYFDMRRSDPAEALKQIGGKGFSVSKNPDSGAWEIVEQGERIEHDNPADYWNTVLKMAKKRSLIDSVLTATAASDCFTQDLEEEDIEDDSKLPEEKTVSGQTHNAPSDNDASPENKNWREAVFHFGENTKGKKLGEVAEVTLHAWIEKWVPKPWPEGSKVLKANDMFLRQALDMAGAELEIKCPKWR